MSDKLIRRIAARVRAHGYGGHSAAYGWLRENFAAVQEMLAGRPSWRVMAEEIAEAGVLGARGQRLTADRLREMWGRVCRDIENEQRERLSGIRPGRKRQADPLRPALAAAPALPVAGGNGVPTQENSFARVRRRMAERSGR